MAGSAISPRRQLELPITLYTKETENEKKNDPENPRETSLQEGDVEGIFG